jgi:hypothetical protein
MVRPSLATPFLALLFLACGDKDAAKDLPSLDDFLPAVPKPDGTARSTYAGAITEANSMELIDGPASSGRVGDYFLRNGQARFVIQSTGRAIGVSPWGGNVVDAVPLDDKGGDLVPDHFGEMSLNYQVGRTCAHDRIEVLRDGKGGGAAVVRVFGVARPNDYVNLRGMGFLPIPDETDPLIEDHVACSTTYTLEPKSRTLEVAFTLYNGGTAAVHGPAGLFNDIGGESEGFAPVIGFSRSGISALTSGEKQSAPYTVYQGPGVGYGIFPRHPDPATTNAPFVVSGVAIMLFGADKLIDIIEEEAYYLDILPQAAVTLRVDVVVGLDGNATEVAYQESLGIKTTLVGGKVSWTSGAPGARARVGVYRDADGGGELDAEDPIVTYMDTDSDGSYRGALAPATYLLRADVKDVARSPVAKITVAATEVSAPELVLPQPARLSFLIRDVTTHLPMPAKLTVVGPHPAAPDYRVFEASDRHPGVVRVALAVYGNTDAAAPGDATDAPLELPAGGPYRIYASRGPEWTVEFTDVTLEPGEALTRTFNLRRVVDTTGYLATEFHQHAIGSHDSPVSYEDRLKSLVVEGIEFFASTDHDFVSDYAPYISLLGLGERILSAVGVEATPFAYGHFIAFPLDIETADPTNGAIDWANGTDDFSMMPADIWKAYREKRGARIIQVNHPRRLGSFSDFMTYFDRAALSFDFVAHRIFGSHDEQPIPSEDLRLPPTSLFDPGFDTVEVWNRFYIADTDGDGVPEQSASDRVLQDWMNFLSLGFLVTPVGNSDTHSVVKDPAGMPRTLVRVSDDSPAALKSGAAAEDVYATLLGTAGTPKDVIVTNGPMIAVGVEGTPKAIGRLVKATGDTVTLSIDVSSAPWVAVDTVEIFANTTFDKLKGKITALVPLYCHTSRALETLAPGDPCQRGKGGPGSFVVEPQDGALTIHLSVVLSKKDLPKREGLHGNDAWVVVRARGERALYPVLLQDAVTESNLETLTTGTDEQVAAALSRIGVPAQAFTAPVLIDFDGDGKFTAPYAP